MQDILDPRIAVRRLLQMAGSSGYERDDVATPIDSIAQQLGLDVATFHPATRRSGTLGWLEPGENLIFLRAGIPEPVRRFTLAHEIGHFVLHRQPGNTAVPDNEPNDQDCDDFDLNSPFDADSDDEALGPGQAYSTRAHREAEANAFAGALLLPPEKLLDRYLNTSEQANGRPRTASKRLRQLADEFGVSEDVLLRQLSALLSPSSRDATADTLSTGTFAGVAAMLDPAQRAAAESETPALVIAGPGTGKTSTLVARVAYLALERKIPAQAILALTFSNKAAREMRERVRMLLTLDHASESTEDERFALPAVSTIHAFCGNVLRSYGPLIGLRADYRLVSEAEGYFLLRDLSDRLYLRYFQPLAAPAVHFPALLGAISRAKDELLDPVQYEASARARIVRASTREEREEAERMLELADIYRAYQQELQARGDADFGDLVLLTVRLFREHPEVLAEYRARYRHVLVDEFQDINHAMGVLLRLLAGEDGRIWAVGDADQAIYRFRGASPGNLAEFSRDYPGSRIHTLQRNFRSAPQILDAAHAVAERFLLETLVGERGPLNPTRSAAHRHTITLATAADEQAELDGLIQAIRTRHAAGRALRDQAVLCRTRRQCQKIAAALSEAGLQAHVAVPLLDQDLPKDILAVLSLVGDSSGTGLLRAGRLPHHAFSRDEARALVRAAHALNTSPVALLKKPPQDASITRRGRAGMRALNAVLADLRRAPSVALGLARYVFSLSAIGQDLLRGLHAGDESASETAGGVERLLTLARAFDDLRTRHRGARGSADYAAFLDYVRVLASLRQDGGAVDESFLAMRDGVHVLTVHASKGLEFPIVYLPELADRKFPTQRRRAHVPAQEAVRDIAIAHGAPEDEHLIEEACLYYVAITRARDELVLTHAERYGRIRYRPSPFLAPVIARLEDALHTERWQKANVRKAVSTTTIGEAGSPEVPDSSLPLHISAVEAYRRCPRQFAYRYVYGLRPREIGLGTLRRSIHDTLTDLHLRFLEARQQGFKLPDQDEADRIFDDCWIRAIAAERGAGYILPGELPGEAVESAGGHEEMDMSYPFLEFYRRHGRRVIRRAWESLTSGTSDQLPEIPLTEFGRNVTVRAGTHEIAIHLDAIERAPVPAMAASGEAGPARSAALSSREQVRLVRHRLGDSNGSPDLRTLLYALAAEQENATADGTVRMRNLTTGAEEALTVEGYRRNKLEEQLAQAIEGMESGVYPPHRDANTCQGCPFLLICPA